MSIRKQDLIRVIENALRSEYPEATIAAGDLGVTIIETKLGQTNGWTIAPRKSDAVIRGAIKVARKWPK